MTGPGIVIAVYGLVVLTTAIISYLTAGSLLFLIAGCAFGFGLVASGLGVLRRKELGFVLAPVLTVLVTAFFGYRSTRIGEFLPSGLVAVLSLVTLFLYFLPRGKKDL
jgi:uncharacterized membrane protein (UPF0136 family)